MSKIFCISDIHGELDKLKNLFEKLSISKKNTLVFLGDYIDRGPDSKGVIDYLLELDKKYKCVFLKGNHEDMAIMSYQKIFASDAWGDRSSPQAQNVWFSNGGIACLQSYNKADTNAGFHQKVVAEMFETHGHFFKKLQTTYETENHIFVHGYLENNVDPAEAQEFLCLWGRSNDIKPHVSGKTVVCGHTIQHSGPKDEGYKVCIDTGSFLPDGCITAMIIDGNKTSFVNSK